MPPDDPFLKRVRLKNYRSIAACDVELGRLTFYHVKGGKLLATSEGVMPPPMSDRLYLVHASGLANFRPVFDALTSIGTYNLNPGTIRELQPADRGEVLSRDGRNLASVVGHIEKHKPAVKVRIEEYLGRVVPGVVGFGVKRHGPMETLEFRQEIEGAREPWTFPAMSMSDGTLRTAAVLVALFQARVEERISLVAIEEPETALHPAAAGVLRDCLREACRHVQVIVTSHSADLLDDADIDGKDIRAVESHGGRTVITPLDDVSRSVLRDKLYTPGELLRANQLRADRSAEPKPSRLKMFDGA